MTRFPALLAKEIIYIINSILAVIYLNKIQNLINRLVMNCSMNIFVYFYFSFIIKNI